MVTLITNFLLSILVAFGWIAPVAVGLRWRSRGQKEWSRLVWLGATWGTINILITVPMGPEMFFAFPLLLGVGSVIGWLFPMIVGLVRYRQGSGGRFLVGAAGCWGIAGSISYLYAAYEGDLTEGFGTVYSGKAALIWLSFVVCIFVIEGAIELYRITRRC